MQKYTQTDTDRRRRISNCKYSSELINRSIYHKRTRYLLYYYCTERTTYIYTYKAYIHTSIQYEAKLFLRVAAQRKRNGGRNRIPKTKKKTSRRRTLPLLSPYIGGINTCKPTHRKYSIQKRKMRITETHETHSQLVSTTTITELAKFAPIRPIVLSFEMLSPVSPRFGSCRTFVLLATATLFRVRYYSCLSLI